MNKHLIIFLLAAALFSSCKKDLDNSGPEPDNESLTQVQDNNEVKGESDQINSDVSDAIENHPSLNGGRISTTTIKKNICGCSIDSSEILNKILTLRFDSTIPCLNPSRYRSGSIRIQLIQGNAWRSESGSVLKITHNNFKVKIGQKSWTFSGDKYLTNVSAVNWLGFLSGADSVLQKERSSNMKITFSGGASTNYSIARKASIKMVKKQATNSYIQLTLNGDTTIAGQANIDSWGTNRFGKSFTTYYVNELISNEYCGFRRPVSGEIIHKTEANTLTVKLGVNEQGNPDTRDCAYGWKLLWSLGSGSSGEKIFSY